MTLIQLITVTICSGIYLTIGFVIFLRNENKDTEYGFISFSFYIITLPILLIYKWIEYGVLVIRGKRSNSKIIKREIIKAL